MKKKIERITIAVASTAFVYTVKAQVHSMNPNPDGTCKAGWSLGLLGTCCPNGMEHIHEYCDTAEHHKQVTDELIKCLARAAVEHRGDLAGYAADAAACRNAPFPPPAGCGPGFDNSTCSSTQSTTGCGPGTDNSTCDTATAPPPAGCGPGFDNSTCGTTETLPQSWLYSAMAEFVHSRTEE